MFDDDDDEEEILEYCDARNRGMAAWIDNPTMIHRAAWPMPFVKVRKVDRERSLRLSLQSPPIWNLRVASGRENVRTLIPRDPPRKEQTV